MGNMSRVPWKVLAVVLWAWIPFCWQPLWGQTPGVAVQSGSQKKQQTKLDAGQTTDGQRGTQDSPLIIETHERPKTDNEAAAAKEAKDRADFVNRWTLRFTGVAAVCTGLLVIVGGLGVHAAIRTLRAIEAQGRHMERQADLLQASMTQWVSVVNWGSTVAQTIGPLSRQPKVLNIEFGIANESNFPLTMEVIFRFGGNLPNQSCPRQQIR